MHPINDCSFEARDHKNETAGFSNFANNRAVASCCYLAIEWIPKITNSTCLLKRTKMLFPECEKKDQQKQQASISSTRSTFKIQERSQPSQLPESVSNNST